MNDLPDDYFLDADDDLVDFLEKQGEDCIGEIYRSNSVNKENGYKLLSILIVGIGSSFLLLTQKTQIDFLSAGIAVFTVYWSVCAIYLVINVLTVHTYGLVSTSPADLYTEAYKGICESDFENLKARGFVGKNDRLSVMRRYRLKTLCVTADELLQVNETIRTRLKKARIATILAPVYAIIISAITYLFFLIPSAESPTILLPTEKRSG
ncbi:hypothetical protein KS553_001324 [Escherichia coli]|nr:hypothetical protein [Escherichia coli]